jgi:hypothetical protein
MKFSLLLPHLRPWILGLDKVWPAYIVKPNFAYWEVLHILALVILGGTSILLGLRLLGYGLTEEKPSELYKNLKVWVHTGVIGITVTGTLIGMANAERLYDSSAFLVKFLSLIAGIVLTYGALRPIALADGAVSTKSKVWGAIGLLVWAPALYVFLTGGLITPGIFHVMSAAALVVLFITRGRLRTIYTAGVCLLLLVMFLATHVFIKWGDLPTSDKANIVLSILMGLWILGAAITQLYMTRGAKIAVEAEGRGPLFSKLVGYAIILVWFCAAAAGRWIAFA